MQHRMPRGVYSAARRWLRWKPICWGRGVLPDCACACRPTLPPVPPQPESSFLACEVEEAAHSQMRCSASRDDLMIFLSEFPSIGAFRQWCAEAAVRGLRQCCVRSDGA